MYKATLFVSFFLIVINCQAQEINDACNSFNDFNTEVLKGTIKKQETQKHFKDLLEHIHHGLLNRSTLRISDGWHFQFPLKGYNYKAIGGTNGNGYSAKGYHYIDGNKHLAHPAHDIFINDRNQDCIDDRTLKPVDVLAADNGVVIACTNSWDPSGNLRGGKYIWIYHYYTGIFTYYAHNNNIFVKPGDEVKQGQKIAEVGRTGYNAYKKRSPTHLHFSTFKLVDDIPVPYNPYEQLKKAKTL